MSEKYNPLTGVRNELSKAVEILGLEQGVYEILKEPMRVIETSLPVKMDNGEVKVFKAFRSMHSNFLGPGKGGIRFHQDVNVDEVKALSIWMSLKCAIAGIPLGGGKGGVKVDSTSLSKREKEEISRAYVRSMYSYLGEKIDIPAPDVGTNGQVMAWMSDEYSKLHGKSAIGTFTGKPVGFGGSLGRVEATGLGIAIISDLTIKKYNLDPKDMKVIIQGFGNVGSFAMKFLTEKGFKVVGLMEYSKELGEYAIYREAGFSYDELEKSMTEFGDLLHVENIEKIAIKDFWSLDADLLVPATLENMINESNMKDIKAKFIIEGANGPTSLEADEYLTLEGKVIVPDVLANSGGVVVSYFEWVQNLAGLYWPLERVLEEEENILKAAFEDICQIKDEYKLEFRQAAYVCAVKKLNDAMTLKGWL